MKIVWERRWIIAAFVLMGLGSLIESASAQTRGGLSIVVELSPFYHHEPVSFRIRNDGAEEACLPNAAPWRIKNLRGVVFTPMAAQVVVCLAPQQSVNGLWDQRDNDGNLVGYGDYTIELFDGQSTALSILSLPGSQGYFTFVVGSEMLHVLMTDPQAIRDATDNHYRLNTKYIPIGQVVDDRPGHSPYDSQWSWHLDPASIQMTENPMELCDAALSYIERHLDEWMNVGVYCPWNAQVIALD